jgi:hypothetical protein
MIPFDPTKVKYDYVYISKISQYSIEINMDDNGEQYLPAGVDYKVKGDKTIIPIHRRVFKLYEKHNFTYEFAGKGRRSCVFYYDGYVLVVDSFKPYTFVGKSMVEEADWVSLNIGAMNKIISLINEEREAGHDRDMFIDGETIFFTCGGANEALDKEGAFWLQPVRFIRLSKMAVGMSQAMEKFFNDKKDDKENDKVNKSEKVSAQEKEASEKKSVIVLKEGYVLGYNPFAGEKEFAVFSPVISEPKTIKRFFDNEKPVYFNLNLALRAGNIIGKHYGFAETDFLDFPSIIINTGIINLKSDVSYQSKASYPLDIPNQDVLAYLFRFLHKETDLNVYRDLVSLVSLAFSTLGTVSGSKLADVFIEGKNLTDIPLRKVEVANIGKENYDDTAMSYEHFQRQDQILKSKFARRIKKKKDNVAQADV